MFVESDFLFALAKPTDWLQADAEAALETADVHTSIATYAEFLQYFYDPDAGAYTIAAAELVPNLLELVAVRPAEHEDALLAAAAFIDDHGLTPYDALHAGIAHVEGETVLSTEQDYDAVGIDRVPLDGYADRRAE
ncbi:MULTISPECIES: PIN domain-containing protein [Halolamina]|uniref:PIN domain-containing protein n=1 Tax=Halolamina pelagica TaxID=699431 RepID=A0A1I5VUV9_9EURY|nr:MULTISPECIES: PIN domain-containing protein [Halolamina]NHX37867.1 PIN domain-containing protein [Halolamina sp. R1-12]SFQ11240.1 PIN domain-containing protein [Halolamina pelagica]